MRANMVETTNFLLFFLNRVRGIRHIVKHGVEWSGVDL